MEINATSSLIEEIECDGVIIWTYEDQNSPVLDKIGDSITNYFEFANFQGKKDQLLSLFNLEGIKASKIVVIGLGKKDKADHEIVRTAVGNATRKLQKLKAKHIAVDAVNYDAQSTSEGIFLSLYEFDELKSKKEENTKIERITFTGNEDEIIEWGNGTITAEAQNIARRLAELPSNIGTPSYFVTQTQTFFEHIN
ncbi:MAG: M17 family peptidase N-terminal domain-containing protein, partial [Candidatus Kariarchaeaceae archaeon]